MEMTDGNVVNVPGDVNSTVSMLPRPINQSQTIPIKLKQCLGYKHHYQFQNVRPSHQMLWIHYCKKLILFMMVISGAVAGGGQGGPWHPLLLRPVGKLSMLSEIVKVLPLAPLKHWSHGATDGDRIISFAPG